MWTKYIPTPIKQQLFAWRDRPGEVVFIIIFFFRKTLAGDWRFDYPSGSLILFYFILSKIQGDNNVIWG